MRILPDGFGTSKGRFKRSRKQLHNCMNVFQEVRAAVREHAVGIWPPPSGTYIDCDLTSNFRRLLPWLPMATLLPLRSISIHNLGLRPLLNICGLPDLQDAQLAMQCCTSAGQGVQTLIQILSQGVRHNVLHTKVEMSFICN